MPIINLIKKNMILILAIILILILGTYVFLEYQTYSKYTFKNELDFDAHTILSNAVNKAILTNSTQLGEIDISTEENIYADLLPHNITSFQKRSYDYNLPIINFNAINSGLKEIPIKYIFRIDSSAYNKALVDLNPNNLLIRNLKYNNEKQLEEQEKVYLSFNVECKEIDSTTLFIQKINECTLAFYNSYKEEFGYYIDNLIEEDKQAAMEFDSDIYPTVNDLREAPYAFINYRMNRAIKILDNEINNKAFEETTFLDYLFNKQQIEEKIRENTWLFSDIMTWYKNDQLQWINAFVLGNVEYYFQGETTVEEALDNCMNRLNKTKLVFFGGSPLLENLNLSESIKNKYPTELKSILKDLNEQQNNEFALFLCTSIISANIPNNNQEDYFDKSDTYKIINIINSTLQEENEFEVNMKLEKYVPYDTEISSLKIEDFVDIDQINLLTGANIQKENVTIQPRKDSKRLTQSMRILKRLNPETQEYYYQIIIS